MKIKNFRIRICLISPLPPPYGGISHWTSMLTAYALDKSNVELFVVNTATRWRAIHSTGVLLRAIGGGIQLFRDVFRLIIALAGRQFDVAHLTTSGQLGAVRDILFYCVTAFFGVPLVYHIRFGRIPVIAHDNSLEWKLVRWVMQRASTVILIDQATYAAVKRYTAGVNAVCVPNCVNFSELPQRLAEPCKVKTALFVGWVIPSKGISELVEAWAKLSPRGWRLEIVGPGDVAYQTQLLSLFQPENLFFIGELSHVEAMNRMANCDLFILPSYTEGFPNVILEAMALGRPIVATEVGAIPEMLENGAGVLIKCKDPKLLEDALSRILSDSELRDALGQRAIRKARHEYSIDVVFDAYLKIWRGA